jgi:hypothetical protein
MFPLADFDYVSFHGISDASVKKGGSLNTLCVNLA